MISIFFLFLFMLLSADLVYNLFHTNCDANVDPLLVMDQLEDTLTKHNSKIDPKVDPKVDPIEDTSKDLPGTSTHQIDFKHENRGDSSPSSSISTQKGDTLSIKSLGSMSDVRSHNLTESKTYGSLKDFWMTSTDSGTSPVHEPSTIPDINHVRKAFWSRRNKFLLGKTKFARLYKKRQEEKKVPKLGAVVSLAAMAAGMTSMPIVQTDDDKNPEKSGKIGHPVKSSKPEKNEKCSTLIKRENSLTDSMDKELKERNEQDQKQKCMLSRLTEEHSMLTDNTLDNISTFTVDSEIFGEKEENIVDLDPELPDELSILTQKLEHEMDELAKLEEEVINEQKKLSDDLNIEMSDDTLTIATDDQDETEKEVKNIESKPLNDLDKKLLVLDSGHETWL